MVIGEEREVRFDLYCKNCKHYNLSEEDDPCFECLENPVASYSKKPMYFEGKE